MNIAQPTTELAKRLRRAARNGGRLHLEPGHVAILMSDEIYRAISALEAKEIRQACAAAVTNDNNVGIIGSGSDPTTGNGAYAGLGAINLDAASRSARLRLTEAMSELQLRKEQSTR